MTVVLTGRDLLRDDVVRVARGGERVELASAAADRMATARSVVEERLAAGDQIYGSSTAAGVLKRTGLDTAESATYSNRVVRQHLVGQGADAPPDVVRATMIRLANGFASGYPGVRPLLAQRLIDALNDGTSPRIRILGSVGQSDLAQMADLAAGLFDGVTLEPGEGLALVSSNSFSSGAATLAVDDAWTLLATAEVAGALSLEALVANLDGLHPGIEDAHPHRGLRTSLANLRRLLDGSALHTPGTARALQDPLSFRTLPHQLGACRDAFDHTDTLLAVELNGSQGNPIVLVEERRVVPTANFESLPLSSALDYLRIAFASLLASSSERSVKLLESPWSGLPTGLASSGDPGDPGLSYLGIAAQSMAAEARLLAAPVSFELVSTAHAEGIEDRMSLAPLAGRRLAEMTLLGARVVAIELAVATQAIDLRALPARGVGTEIAAATVRRHVPFLARDATVPDLESLVDAVRRRAFSRSDPSPAGPDATYIDR
ncbi:MAG: aromatic amino acid ammonia-lyase [Chloroflexota bacterium]